MVTKSDYEENPKSDLDLDLGFENAKMGFILVVLEDDTESVF